VPCAEEVDKSIPGDGLRTKVGGALDGIKLGGFDAL
jgi:hypothetical protein